MRKSNFESFFIYVSETQEESPMDNEKHWKRGNETYIGIPTLIYILQKSQVIRDRDPEINISSIQTRRHTHRGSYSFTHD
jgi:hypothetical protein